MILRTRISESRWALRRAEEQHDGQAALHVRTVLDDLLRIAAEHGVDAGRDGCPHSASAGVPPAGGTGP